MKRALTLSLLLAIPVAGAATRAHDLAAALFASALDPASCYRVHDLRLAKPGLRIYFNSGYLIFAKPVNGVRPGAYFAADAVGGDGEVLVVPPDRAERLSLTRFTGAPNLDAHFRAAFLIFGDDTAARLEPTLAGSRVASPAAGAEKIGAALSTDASPTLVALYRSFGVRLILDLLSPDRARGMFVLSAIGTALGGFDAVYDPSAGSRVTVGQFAERNQQQFFDVWTSFSQAASSPAAPPPPAALPSYRVDATFGAGLTLEATARIGFDTQAELRGPLACLVSARVTILDARLDGDPAEVYQPAPAAQAFSFFDDGQDFLVVPARAIAPGRHRLEFRYTGNVIRRTPEGLLFVASRGTWYPQLGDGLADFDLRFDLPAALNLVATGDIVEDSVSAGRRHVHVVTSKPIRFAGFNVGDFETADLDRGKFHLRICADRLPPLAPPSGPPPGALPRTKRDDLPPRAPSAESYRDALRRVAASTGPAFDFLDSLLGPPPLTTITVSPIPGSFGQGFPGLVYLSTVAYQDPEDAGARLGTRSSRTFFFDLLETHEIAHQWWGNLVVPADGGDEWLIESLANYCALMYLERRKGTAAVQQVLDEYRRHLLSRDAEGRTVESAGPIVWGPRLRSSADPGAWRIITYEKGSWIIHMLRERLGDERFRALLRALCTRFAATPLATAQLDTVAKEFLPGDATLAGFFDNWVYGTGIPSLKLSYSVRGGRLSGSIEQRDVDADFSAWVPIEIRDGASSHPSLRWIETGAEPAQFSVPVHSRSARAAIAPGMLARPAK